MDFHRFRLLLPQLGVLLYGHNACHSSSNISGAYPACRTQDSDHEGDPTHGLVVTCRVPAAQTGRPARGPASLVRPSKFQIIPIEDGGVGVVLHRARRACQRGIKPLWRLLEKSGLYKTLVHPILLSNQPPNQPLVSIAHFLRAHCADTVLRCPAMFSKSFVVAGFVALLAAAAPVNGARVRFYTTRDSCKGSPSQDYQNVKCNSCIDPPGGTSSRPLSTSERCG